jgi:DNA modification methylase
MSLSRQWDFLKAGKKTRSGGWPNFIVNSQGDCMSKINMTEEELTKLLEAVNAGVEPTPELAGKLFPTLMEKLGQEGKFDFETLNRIKIPTIEYAGKRSEGVILASAAALGQSAPLQVVRSFGEPGEDGWKNLIIQGDNLQFLKTVYLNQDSLVKDKIKGKVKLVCIDPPFATKSDFKSNDGAKSYSDKTDTAEFLENLRERLIYLREILASDGTIFVHLDEKMSQYVKIILDEIFDKSSQINEIIWHYKTFQGQTHSYFAKKHDTIFWYKKSDKYFYKDIYDTEFTETIDSKRWKLYFNDKQEILGCNMPIQDSRFIRYLKKWIKENGKNPAPGDVVYKALGQPVDTVWEFKEDDGGLLANTNIFDDDTVWHLKGLDPKSSEKTGYPTQKPEALLERIIKASTKPGDLVMDIFGGSGTTAATAEKLGCRWVTCDFGKHSIYTMQKRILRIGESKAFNVVQKDAKYGQPPKAFAVASVGAYDFSRIMNLRENKCAYISFVLALFGIPKEEKDYVAKYKLDHIYAERDGDPVEIFPVWDDQFLYNVRIDQEYLKDIITQSRGRLKGNFYIAVPESCTQVSDIKLPNGSGGEVHFHFLKFPYSILEQASRNFAIEDQPDTAANINNLVSSVGFYFNDKVVLKVAKTSKGLEITKFTTPILNRDGAAYTGLSGLSLLLVDIDYNREVFDMEHAVYAKDIPENGEIVLAGVTAITAVIAIDKHGNESKPTLISE